ncbi:hypothetical protein [Brevundimonas sp.]|uniref:hypothetical protein n=1 Tax=Brevundimonas sp. TaxID=1871086 RepID=UPI00391D9A46
MKIASLLAGVAAVALTAGAVSAQDIHQGQSSLTGSATMYGNNGGFLGPVLNIPANANLANAQNDGSSVSSWHAVGNAVDNIGTAETSDGATFTLTGSVSTDCAYYSGNNNTETLDFGQIGIYASDNTGPAAAFTMVAPAVLSIDTNLAGCNTANTVRIQKTDVRGMVNNSGSGYDTDVFQANLPYSIAASYTASGTGAPAAGSAQTLTVAENADQASRQHGAWKSAMSLDIVVPTPARALLAGTYAGTFGVTISAGL